MCFTRRNREFLVKKCWYHDHEGHKCPNSGGKMQYIIDAIEDQLKEYEKQIQSELDGCEDQSTDIIQQQIKNISLQLKKKDMALQRARTAYDEGVDTLDEYRSAKDRINKEIESLEQQLNIQNLKLQKTSALFWGIGDATTMAQLLLTMLVSINLVRSGDTSMSLANITAIITLVVTLGSNVLMALAAYPLSKADFPFKKPVLIFFIITMLFSSGIVPIYLLMSSVNLTENISSAKLSQVKPSLFINFLILNLNLIL